MYSKPCHALCIHPAIINLNSLSLSLSLYTHTHTHTHTLCSVLCLCVSTGMFVLHTDIFGYQSLFVCVCVRVEFLPLKPAPSCVASHGCPIGTFSLSSSDWLMSKQRERHRERERGGRGREGGREEGRGMITEGKKKKIAPRLVEIVLFIHRKGCSWWLRTSACDLLDACP